MGGAGFIGSYLTQRLRHLGAEPFVADAFRPYATPTHARDRHLRDALLGSTSVDHIDLLDYSRLSSALLALEPDVVVNLAANPIVGSADRDPAGCERDIVESARNLVTAIASTPSVRRLVQVSSSMVYGNFAGALATEASETVPVNAYGRMKLAAEDIVRELGAQGIVETVIIRPMAVYGPGDAYERVVSVFCAQAMAGVPLSVRTSADASIDFSYVRDIADGLAAAALKPAAAGEIFNLSYGQGRSLLDLVAALQQHFPDLEYEILPATGAARPSRGALDIDKARHLLGFQPAISLEMGIDRCIRFLRGAEEADVATIKEMAQ